MGENCHGLFVVSLLRPLPLPIGQEGCPLCNKCKIANRVDPQLSGEQLCLLLTFVHWVSVTNLNMILIVYTSLATVFSCFQIQEDKTTLIYLQKIVCDHKEYIWGGGVLSSNYYFAADNGFCSRFIKYMAHAIIPGTVIQQSQVKQVQGISVYM